MTRHAAIQKRMVWDGRLTQTDSGLHKKDLAVSKSKNGQIVSKAKQAIGRKRMKELIKSGQAAPVFGAEDGGKKKRKRKSAGPKKGKKKATKRKSAKKFGALTL